VTARWAKKKGRGQTQAKRRESEDTRGRDSTEGESETSEMSCAKERDLTLATTRTGSKELQEQNAELLHGLRSQSIA
jgi:hypothetical protein